MTFVLGRKSSFHRVDGLKVSELAARSRVPATTLRFYEQEGLLPAERTPPGYWVYDDAAVPAFIVAAVFEIGGAWLVWQTLGEHRAWWLAVLGVTALGLYGIAASLQPDAAFGASWPPTAGCSWPAPCCGVCCSTDIAPTGSTSSAPSSASSASS